MIKKSEQELKIFEKDSDDSFYFAILYTTYYALQDKKEDFHKLIEVFGRIFFEKFEGKEESLRLDLSLSTSQAQCHVIGNLLMGKKFFLRVLELRKKVSLPYQKSSTKQKCCSKRSFSLSWEAFQLF